MIDEGQTSPAAGVMLVDRTTDLTQVIIEISHTQGIKKDGRKLINLVLGYDVLKASFMIICSRLGTDSLPMKRNKKKAAFVKPQGKASQPSYG